MSATLATTGSRRPIYIALRLAPSRKRREIGSKQYCSRVGVTTAMFAAPWSLTMAEEQEKKWLWDCYNCGPVQCQRRLPAAEIFQRNLG